MLYPACFSVAGSFENPHVLACTLRFSKLPAPRILTISERKLVCRLR